MRRVYDDTMYETISERIMDAIAECDVRTVTKQDYGMVRAQVGLIRKYIEGEMPDIKYGRNEHAHGIGNNNAIEIIYTGDEEEQICGLLHLTNDMFGSVLCWCSDIDGRRRTVTYKVNEHGVRINN